VPGGFPSGVADRRLPRSDGQESVESPPPFRGKLSAPIPPCESLQRSSGVRADRVTGMAETEISIKEDSMSPRSPRGKSPMRVRAPRSANETIGRDPIDSARDAFTVSWKSADTDNV